MTGAGEDMPDQPIAHTAEGRPLFDNTPTVVCVIVQNRSAEILAVRRANEPGKGLLGLPGGYHMRGETWQAAGAREVIEETSIELAHYSDLYADSIVTDEYGNNLIIANYPYLISQKGAVQDGEALEVVWLDRDNMRAEDWAFPRHYAAVLNFFQIHLGV